VFLSVSESRIFFARSRSLGFASLAEILQQKLTRWASRVSVAEILAFTEAFHSARVHAHLIWFPLTITMRTLWCWNRAKAWSVTDSPSSQSEELFFLIFMQTFSTWHIYRWHIYYYTQNVIANDPDDWDDLCGRSGRLCKFWSFAIIWVAFPYDRPDRLNIFWDEPDNHMETRLKWAL